MYQPRMKPQIQQQYRQLKSKVQDEIRQLQEKLSSNSEIHYHRSITGSSRYLQEPIQREDQYRTDSHVIRINNVGDNTVTEERVINIGSNGNLCHSRSHSHCHCHHHQNHNAHNHNNINSQSHNNCTSTKSSRCNNHLPNPLIINTQQKCSRRSSCSINHYNNHQPSLSLNINRPVVVNENSSNNLRKINEKVLELEDSNLQVGNINMNGMLNQKLLEQNMMLEKAYIKSVQQQQSLSSDIRLLQDKISRLQYQSSQINIINTPSHETPSNRSSKRTNSYQFKVLSVHQNQKYQHHHNNNRDYQYLKKGNQQKSNDNNRQHFYQHQNQDTNSIRLDDSKNSKNSKNNRLNNNTRHGQKQNHHIYHQQNKFENLLLKQQSRKYHQNQSNYNNSKPKSKSKSKLIKNKQHINSNKSSRSNNKNSITLSNTNKSIAYSTSRSQSKSKLSQKFTSKNRPIYPQSDVSQQYMIAKVKSQPKIKFNNYKPSNNNNNKNTKHTKQDENNQHWQHDYFGYDKFCPVHIDPKMFKLNNKQKQVYKDSNYRNRKHQRDHLIQSYKQQQIARKKLIQKILNYNGNKPAKNSK